MKTTAVLGSAIIMLVSCSMAAAQWPQQTFACRNWEFEAGTRIVDRAGSDSPQPLIREATTNLPLFTVSDATDLNTSAGVDGRLLRKNAYGVDWEIRGYFHQWDNFHRTTGNLQTPLVFGLPISNVDYAYSSDLYSIELNWKRACFPGWTFFAGPRFVYIEDLLQVDATTPNFQGSGLDAVIQTNIRTKNPLFGAQVGVEFRSPLTRNLFVVSNVKAGGYGNNAQNDTIAQTFIGGFPVAQNAVISQTRSVGAFVGEVAVRLHYDVVPGTISLYTGYEASWFDGIAVAPAQVLSALVPNQPPVHVSSTPFVQGLVIGGMVRF